MGIDPSILSRHHLSVDKRGFIFDPAPSFADPDEVYDVAYMEKFLAYEKTEQSAHIQEVRIQATRAALGASYTGTVVEFGSGVGTFWRAFREATQGAVSIFPYEPHADAVPSRGLTFSYLAAVIGSPSLIAPRPWGKGLMSPGRSVIVGWDTFEHVKNPYYHIRDYAAVALTVPCMPDLLFEEVARAAPEDRREVMAQWKHYRPEEHFWHWTEDGLVAWMLHNGFRSVKIFRPGEEAFGREDVITAVFVNNDDE